MLSAMLTLVSLVGSAAALRPNVAMRPRGLHSGRAHVQLMADDKLGAFERYGDAILNPDIPDPVFDGKSPYKGRVSYGFTEVAESLNGRAAMMGFTVLFLQELIVGKGVLEQYGLPYDEGAVLMQTDGFVLPSVLGLFVAIFVTVGGLYGGEKLFELITGKESTGAKLPKSPSDLLGK